MQQFARRSCYSSEVLSFPKEVNPKVDLRGRPRQMLSWKRMNAGGGAAGMDEISDQTAALLVLCVDSGFYIQVLLRLLSTFVMTRICKNTVFINIITFDSTALYPQTH